MCLQLYQVVKKSTIPLSKERIPEAVKKLGHEVLEIEEVSPGEWKIYIKVK